MRTDDEKKFGTETCVKKKRDVHKINSIKREKKKTTNVYSTIKS